jgi:hypothetical protein
MNLIVVFCRRLMANKEFIRYNGHSGESVPQSDRIFFTQALHGVLDIHLHPHKSISEWSRSRLATSTWQDFLTRVESNLLSSQVTITLSPKARKLIRDCIVSLVAERRMRFLKGT